MTEIHSHAEADGSYRVTVPCPRCHKRTSFKIAAVELHHHVITPDELIERAGRWCQCSPPPTLEQRAAKLRRMMRRVAIHDMLKVKR